MLATLLLGAAPSSTTVHDLPRWAQEIARATVAAAVPREAPAARVLLAETHLEILAEGTTVVRERRAVQVLRTPARGAGQYTFFVDPGYRLRLARAFHVPSTPTRREDAISSIEVNADPSLFSSDARARLVAVGDLRPGSLVFFEFESFGPQPTLDLSHAFGDPFPQEVSRLAVELPPGWSLRHEWLRLAGPVPERTGRRWTWTLRDLKRERRMPLSVPPEDQEPRLAVTVLPAFPLARSVALDSWTTAAAWYEELAQGREAVTPAIRGMADRACAAAETPGAPQPWARIDAIARYVRDGVRYVAREVGIGAYRPRPAAATAAELVGDCKDKGTLLRALLAAKGIRSHAVLVNLTQNQTVPSQVPSLGAFNHFVVAVHVPDGATLPDPMNAAVLDGGPLGRLIILDVTQEYLSPGAVSASLGGKRALLLAGKDSRIVTLPNGDAGAHRIERSLEVEIHDVPGSAQATWRQISRLRGEPATELLSASRGDAEASRRRAQAILDGRWPGAHLTSYQVGEERQDGALEETMTWTTSVDPGDLEPFPFLDHDLPRVPLGKRTRPVVYPHPLSLSYTVRMRGVPSPSRAPQTVDLRGSGWHVARTWRELDGAWTGTLEATLGQTLYAPEEFGELRKLWGAVGGAAGSQGKARSDQGHAPITWGRQAAGEGGLSLPSLRRPYEPSLNASRGTTR